MNSKFLKVFTSLEATGNDFYHLIGDSLLVEEVPEEEVKTESGLILPSGTQKQVDSFDDNRPMYVRVLAVGEGHYDLNGKDVPLDTEMGDIGIVGKLSVEWFSTFAGLMCNVKGHRIGLMRESALKIRFRGQEGYDQVSRILRTNS